MRWRNRSLFALKIARIHNNYTRLEYYPETTEEQANVFKKGILQSGKLLWLSYEMKNNSSYYSELGGVICFGLRPQLASSGRSDGGEWREMESWAQKREGGGEGGEGKRQGGGSFAHSPHPQPRRCVFLLTFLCLVLTIWTLGTG